jgi:hypothetical protein
MDVISVRFASVLRLIQKVATSNARAKRAGLSADFFTSLWAFSIDELAKNQIFICAKDRNRNRHTAAARCHTAHTDIKLVVKRRPAVKFDLRFAHE